MRRRDFIALPCGVFLIAAGASQAAERVHRIGYLWPGREGSDETPLDGLRQGLRELGYVEGRNLVIERRYADGRGDRLRALAEELARLRVDLIRAPGTAATRAAQQATTTIPIVTTASDPVGSGFVASLARPGGNITGLSLTTGPEIAGKRLELLREVAPGLARAAFLWDAASPPSTAELATLRAAGAAMGIDIASVAITASDEIDAAFARAAEARATAVIVDSTPLILDRRAHVAALAVRHRLPAIYSLPDYVVAGGLMSYGMSLPDVGRRVAFVIDRILKGARPAEMPVEQPTRFELVVSLAAARALGIEVPAALLARADEVIE